MSNLEEEYIAVGNTFSDKPGVVVVMSNLGSIKLAEHAARKLADDILRNANYVWPQTEGEIQ